MADVMAFFVFLLMVGILAMFYFRYRDKIHRWIKDPTYKPGDYWKISRETKCKRDIEDAQAELKWLEKNKDKPEE